MTDEPRRFRDDPNERRLGRDLSAAHEAPGPDYDVERGLARLSATIALAAAASTGDGGAAGQQGAQTGSTQGAAQAGTHMGATAAKLWPWAAGAAGTAALALGLMAGGAGEDRAPASVPATAPMVASPASANHNPGQPATARPAAATSRQEPATLAAPEPPPRHARPRPRAQAPRALAPSDPDAMLRQEIALVASARTELERNPARALHLLEEGQRRFGRGMLGEERQALLILTLHRVGRTREAEQRAERFLATHPRSPLADRVREIAP